LEKNTTFAQFLHNFSTEISHTMGNINSIGLLSSQLRGGAHMFRRRTFFGILTVILAIVLLVAGGAALYRFGYAKGYAVGSASEGVAEGELPGVYQRGYFPHFSHPMRFFPFGGLFGLFLGGMLLIMLFSAASRLVWYRHWKTAGPTHHGWHGPPSWWGPPPWAQGEKPPEAKDGTDDEPLDT
jgi:hypothetical protein